MVPVYLSNLVCLFHHVVIPLQTGSLIPFQTNDKISALPISNSFISCSMGGFSETEISKSNKRAYVSYAHKGRNEEPR